MMQEGGLKTQVLNLLEPPLETEDRDFSGNPQTNQYININKKPTKKNAINMNQEVAK